MVARRLLAGRRIRALDPSAVHRPEVRCAFAMFGGKLQQGNTPPLIELWSQAERRFGVRPAFLACAGEPSVAWGLFRFAEHAYLDNPIPSLFKEALFAYLARFCDERYCLLRHCAFLLGRGHVAGDPSCAPLGLEQTLALLDEPLPEESELPRWLERFESIAAPLDDWPDPMSAHARAVRVACAAVFMDPSEKAPWLRGLLGWLGPARHEHLLLFLGFVRTALSWTEMHPGLRCERDVEQLLNEHPRLARRLLDESPASRWKFREALRASGTDHAFLLALSDRMRALGDPREIMRAAAQMLGQHLGVSMVQYGLVDAAQEGVELAAIYNDGRLPSMPEGRRFRFADVPGWGAALLAGQEVFSDDNEADPRDLARGEPRALGLVAGSAVPLIKNGRLVATLATADPEPRRWTKRERQLQRDVAERTWDAAERARAEAATRDLLLATTAARDAAKLAIKAKDEFLATLSHELRTPIAAILLWGNALHSGAMRPDDLARALDAILQSAESQSLLIDDLIDLSRLTSGKLRLAPKYVDLENVARAAVKMIEPAAQAKRIALEVDVAAELGAAFLDGARLQRVVWNLLSNAIKFTPRGGNVSLRAHRVGNQLEIEVIDDGEGIAPDYMPRVFDRFSQGDSGQNRRYSGLGIGLALSRQIVALLGGTLHVHSDGPGRGACFRLRIPCIERGESATSAGQFPLHGMTVLLVGNDAMQRTLERAGASVVMVDSGTRALAIIDAEDGESTPHAVISELELPDMDGYELIEHVLRRCRAQSRVPLPACAVSTQARGADRQRAIDAGFDLYLSKPVASERLIEAVQDLRDIARAQER
jgi:signal transduction histidine kinase/CheY-like chemotaxis protein